MFFFLFLYTSSFVVLVICSALLRVNETIILVISTVMLWLEFYRVPCVIKRILIKLWSERCSKSLLEGME